MSTNQTVGEISRMLFENQVTCVTFDDDTKKQFMNILLGCNCCHRHSRNHTNGLSNILCEEMSCFCNNYFSQERNIGITYETSDNICRCECRHLARHIVRISNPDPID